MRSHYFSNFLWAGLLQAALVSQLLLHRDPELNQDALRERLVCQLFREELASDLNKFSIFGAVLTRNTLLFVYSTSTGVCLAHVSTKLSIIQVGLGAEFTGERRRKLWLDALWWYLDHHYCLLL